MSESVIRRHAVKSLTKEMADTFRESAMRAASSQSPSGTGDWPDDQSGTRRWRPTHDVVDTAVIFVMLANAIWTSADCEMDEEDEKPAEADRLLWTFAPWAGCSGFWTNNDRTVIRMQGSAWGLTARR